MTRSNLRLDHERSFARANIRTVYWLIRFRYRNDPDFFKPYPPEAVMAMAREHRSFFPSLYPWFAFYARNMACGLTCEQLRDMEPENTIRAVAKKRAVPRR